MDRSRPASSASERLNTKFFSVLLLNMAPGALAGALLAGLLFFLNPHIPVTAGTLLQGATAYGVVLALLSAAVLTLWTRGSYRKASRLFPWSLTTVLGGACLATWVCASHFSYFLPPGINIRLIKAAAGLTASGLVVFYTALLHTLNRRRYGPRSRVGLILAALFAAYIMLERREAFDPPPTPTPLPTELAQAQRPRLVVVGLEGATLDAVLPLAEQGQLPFFSRLLRIGSYGRLESFTPTVQEALWTTLGTGKLPYRHRILGPKVYEAGLLAPGHDLRLSPPGVEPSWWGGTVPADGSHRHALHLWEILASLGLSAGVIDWPVAVPTRRPLAFAFSDTYFEGDVLSAEARPGDLASRGVMFEVEAEEIDPGLIEQLGGPFPYSFLTSLAEDLWRQSLSRFLRDQNDDLEVLFLRLQGLAAVSARQFGGYAAAQFDGDQRPGAQASARLLTAYYRHLDLFLSEVWSEVPQPKVLAVVSAYGYGQPKGVERVVATVRGRRERGTTSWAPDGLFLLAGEGVRRANLVTRAELVDIVPTLVHAVGLPVARDLDGRVITEAFQSGFLARRPLTFVPSYESLLLQEEPAVPATDPRR